MVITFRAEGPSGLFEMLSGVTGSVKAGHGVSCSNFLVLRKSGVLHFEQQYVPMCNDIDNNTFKIV